MKMSINREVRQSNLGNKNTKEQFLKESSNALGMNKMNQETIQALRDVKNGRLHGAFSSAEELIKSINK